jgi:uncharacterized membrane protein (DUF485 family)
MMGYPVPYDTTADDSAFGQEINPFGGSTEQVRPPKDEPLDFVAIQLSPDFARLRERIVRFVFPMTALFLGWYLCYVLLAAYARSFMSFQVLGAINVGLLLGLLQFVSTILITIRYVRFARREVDPDVARIQERSGVTAE